MTVPMADPMSVPDLLSVHRQDEENRAQIRFAGEIDLSSAPLVRESLGQCLLDGIRVIDVDLSAVGFCDCSGLNAFLHASWRSAAARGSLRLHDPIPLVARLFTLTGAGFLLLGAGPPYGFTDSPRPPRPPAQPRPEAHPHPQPRPESQVAAFLPSSGAARIWEP